MLQLCTQCGAEFNAYNSRHKTCSGPCAKSRQRQAQLDWKKNNKDKHNAQTRRSYYRNREEMIKRAAQCAKDNPGRTRLKTIKMKCNKLDLAFDLDADWIDSGIPEYCPILGFKLDGESRETSWEVDRIIPSLGYVKSNCRIISGRANRLKSDATLDELEKIVEYLKSS